MHMPQYEVEISNIKFCRTQALMEQRNPILQKA